MPNKSPMVENDENVTFDESLEIQETFHLILAYVFAYVWENMSEQLRIKRSKPDFRRCYFLHEIKHAFQKAQRGTSGLRVAVYPWLRHLFVAVHNLALSFFVPLF